MRYSAWLFQKPEARSPSLRLTHSLTHLLIHSLTSIQREYPKMFDNGNGSDDEEMPVLVDAATITKQIPVSIMTGFLGSGKTTLLNYLLRHQHGKRIAIIENEFSGGLGIENMIAKSGVDGEDMAGQYRRHAACAVHVYVCT